MKHDMELVLEEYVRTLISRNRGQQMRNVQAILGNNLDNINEYGCWCFFQEDHGRGHGKPVDGLDRFCRKMHMGYDCAIMDVLDSTGNDSCVPWEVPYISGTGGGESSLVNTCEVVNSDDCAKHACMVEGFFVIQIFNLFVSGESVDDSYKHSNGFDDRGGCPTLPGYGESEKACCGEYPDRFPFKLLNGDRGCCQGVAYDAIMLSCCPDGVPRFSC